MSGDSLLQTNPSVLENRPPPVVIAADNDDFRSRIVGILEQGGIAPAKVGNSGVIHRLEPELLEGALIVLDTNDNIVRLVQSVNDLYRNPFNRTGAAAVICVVSQEAFDRHQQLGWWLIDGHAAVFSVNWRDWEGWRNLPTLVQRLATSKADQPAPAPPPRTFEALCDSLCENAADATTWLDLALLALRFDGIIQVREEIAAAAARQAVRLTPDSAAAHATFGRALWFLGRYDEAASECREALRITPELVETHRDLANVLYQQGDKAEARREFETVIRLDPSGKWAPSAKQALENWRW